MADGEVSCNDSAFAVGAFAAAPPAIIKDIPAAPNAGKPTRRRFRLETCFVRAIVSLPSGFRLNPANFEQSLRLRQAMGLSNIKRVTFCRRKSHLRFQGAAAPAVRG